jgi:hypothetical protein
MLCVFRLAFCAAITVAGSGLLVSQDREFVHQSADTGIITWHIGQADIAAASAPAITVANDPQTGARQIGLTHRGYTGPEPTGRSAVLLLSIDLRSLVATNGCDRVTVVGPRQYTLDVELPADKAEEERLRRQAGLPRQITSGSISVIQFRWDNVAGRMLFNWLSKPDGLRITAQSSVNVKLSVEARRTLDASAFDSWWATRFGSGAAQASWIGGPDAITLDAIAAGVYSASSSPELSHSLLSEGASTSTISKCVSQKASVAGDRCSATHTDIVSCFPPLAVTSNFSTHIGWHSISQISGSLMDNEIIDGTKQKSGLSALLDDGS